MRKQSYPICLEKTETSQWGLERWEALLRDVRKASHAEETA